MNDDNMTRVLRACEQKGVRDIITMDYPWNDEVIAQFYATLWIKKVGEEVDVYDCPVMYFFLQGVWHKVSYCHFAHILDFSDEDIRGRNLRVHDIRLPRREDKEVVHISNGREYWITSNMHR